jgi:hypothetical protein
MERNIGNQPQSAEATTFGVLHKPGAGERKRLGALRKIDRTKGELKKTGRKMQIGDPLGPRVPRTAAQ